MGLHCSKQKKQNIKREIKIVTFRGYRPDPLQPQPQEDIPLFRQSSSASSPEPRTPSLREAIQEHCSPVFDRDSDDQYLIVADFLIKGRQGNYEVIEQDTINKIKGPAVVLIDETIVKRTNLIEKIRSWKRSSFVFI